MDGMTFIQPGCIIRGIDGNNTVRGTAISYFDGSGGTECQPYGDDTYERLAPGCFDECLARGQDVIATFDHKQTNLLGRTPATLRLKPHAGGIDVELDLPDTQLGRDTKRLIERGDIRGFSFIAKPDKRDFRLEGSKRVLTIRSFKSLHEVSLVVFPYYGGSQIKRGRDFLEEAERQSAEIERTRELIEAVKNLSL